MKMFLLIAFEVLTFTAFRFDLAYGSKGLPAYCRAVDQLSIEVRDCLSNRELVAATELCEKGFAQKLEFSRQSLNKSFELRLKKQKIGRAHV